MTAKLCGFRWAGSNSSHVWPATSISVQGMAQDLTQIEKGQNWLSRVAADAAGNPQASNIDFFTRFVFNKASASILPVLAQFRRRWSRPNRHPRPDDVAAQPIS